MLFCPPSLLHLIPFSPRYSSYLDCPCDFQDRGTQPFSHGLLTPCWMASAASTALPIVRTSSTHIQNASVYHRSNGVSSTSARHPTQSANSRYTRLSTCLRRRTF